MSVAFLFNSQQLRLVACIVAEKTSVRSVPTSHGISVAGFIFSSHLKCHPERQRRVSTNNTRDSHRLGIRSRE